MSTMRCFIGVPIGPPADRHLARTIDRLSRRLEAVRWVDPRGLHLTLKYLGETQTTAIPDISARIADLCREVPPMELGIEGLGCFPPQGTPRVLWAGAAGECEPLIRLHKQLDASMLDFGFSSESRGFSPHITLGRVGRIPGKRIDEIRAALAGEPLETRCYIDRIILFESSRQRQGMEYIPLSTTELQKR